MYRLAKARVQLNRLRNNIRSLKKINAETAFFCPMVKGNAYGHGEIEVSRVIVDEGVQNLGVALVEEGIRIREAISTDIQIFVFSPCLDARGLSAMMEHHLTPVVSSWPEIYEFEKLKCAAPKKMHIKFNTGMNRLGFSLSEADKIESYMNGNTSIQLTGVCTHLISGEDAYGQPSRTVEQLAQFQQITNRWTKSGVCTHSLNSSALLSQHCHRHKGVLANGSRPGISIYGIKPKIHLADSQAKQQFEEFELSPVMEVSTEVIHVQDVEPGGTVSYDSTYRAEKKTQIGVLPIGYADGYTRRLSGLAKVLCAGHKVDVTGIICMDYTMVDLTPLKLPDAELFHQKVILLGEQNELEISAEDLAHKAQTNTYEILTQFSGRLPRVYE